MQNRDPLLLIVPATLVSGQLAPLAPGSARNRALLDFGRLLHEVGVYLPLTPSRARASA